MVQSLCVPSACRDLVKVTNYYGSSYHSCFEFNRIAINFPSEISYKNCTESIWGNSPCVAFGKYYCGNYPTAVALSLYSVVLTLLVACVMMLRHRRVVKDLSSTDIELKTSLTAVTAIPKSEGNPIKMSLLAYMLFLLTGDKLVLSCIIPNENHMLLTSGSTFCTTNGNLTIDELIFPLKLNLMYNTSDYDMTTVSDWGCAGGSCPEVSVCETMNNLPHTFNEPKIIEQQFCSQYPSACMFGRGCKYGVHTLRTKTIFSVHSVESILSHSAIKNKLKCDIEVEDNNKDIGWLQLVQNGDLAYLCRGASLPHNPRSGALGDIQFHGTKTGPDVYFDWTSINCGRGWYDGHYCRNPSSFMSNIDKLCCRLPCTYGEGSIYLDGSLSPVFRVERTLRASFDCSSGNSTVVLTSNQCSPPRIELWGVRNSGRGLFLSYQSHSLIQGQDILFHDSCLPFDLAIPCDGKIRHMPVSESNICNFTDHTVYPNEFTMFHTHLDESFSPIYHVASNSVSPFIHLVFVVLILIATFSCVKIACK